MCDIKATGLGTLEARWMLWFGGWFGVFGLGIHVFRAFLVFLAWSAFLGFLIVFCVAVNLTSCFSLMVCFSVWFCSGLLPVSTSLII